MWSGERASHRRDAVEDRGVENHGHADAEKGAHKEDANVQEQNDADAGQDADNEEADEGNVLHGAGAGEDGLGGVEGAATAQHEARGESGGAKHLRGIGRRGGAAGSGEVPRTAGTATHLVAHEAVDEANQDCGRPQHALVIVDKLVRWGGVGRIRRGRATASGGP